MGELQSARRHAASRGQSNDMFLSNLFPGALLCIMYYGASTGLSPAATERMATVMHIWCDAAT
jgi:hypothetical protein